MPVNTKYPNLPDGFREAVKKARLEKGWTLYDVAKRIGVQSPLISQLERGDRNFNYDRAVQIRDLLDMDFDLPPVDFKDAPKVSRNRSKYELRTDQFFVEIDGQLIKVISYYEMGPVIKGQLIKENDGPHG